MEGGESRKFNSRPLRKVFHSLQCLEEGKFKICFLQIHESWIEALLKYCADLRAHSSLSLICLQTDSVGKHWQTWKPKGRREGTKDEYICFVWTEVWELLNKANTIYNLSTIKIKISNKTVYRNYGISSVNWNDSQTTGTNTVTIFS